MRVCKMCFNFLEPIYLDYQIKHGNLSADTRTPSRPSPFSYGAIPKRIKETLSLREADSVQEKASAERDDEEEEEEANREEVVVPVVQRRVKTEQLHDSSSSSSLTEEQMQVVTSFFQNEENLNTDKSTDESESLTSSEEENIDLGEVEENTRNLTLKVDSSLVTDVPQKSSPPPLPLTKPIVKSANCGDEPSPTNQSDVRPASVASKLFGRVCNREVAHAEYGYVCKVPIVNQTLEDTAETSPGKSNSNKKWDRHFIALYTDGTIGICSNQNVNSEIRVVLIGFISLFGCFFLRMLKVRG